MSKLKVRKRDGSIQDFDINKIRKVVKDAFNTTKETVDESKLNKLLDTIGLKNYDENYIIDIETIQDVVETILMQLGCYKTAKEFILYREKHKECRILKERLEYMMGYMQSSNNAASSSEEDSNANVSLKNVANLNAEVYKNLNRRLQRMWMKNKLKELYPNEDIYNQYEKDLANHIIYAHDEASFSVPTNYCEAVTLYPLLLNGTSTMDGLKTKPPHNLNSFCGQLVNLTFLLAAQCKGAVAFGEFFNFFDYFCVKEWGKDYIYNLNSTVTQYSRQRTIKDIILQSFQQIVYSWNQPASNRGFQSPFINISYYDSNYWKALFGDFYFPDGTQPKWERVDVLQKLFMKWFNSERKKTLMAFPVETMALLTDGKDVIDKDYKDFTAEMWAEGHSFFLYLSDNPDGLSSCCRLKNKIGKNEFSFTNGLSGVKTGSCNVITLNLNRIIQDCAEKHNYLMGVSKIEAAGMISTKGRLYYWIKEDLCAILERVYKYHIAYKTLLYEEEEKGMMTSSTAGYISMRDLFSTIGINGINEAAEFLGIKCTYNEDYKNFCRLITGIISEQNKLHSTSSFKFNQEFVPAEQLGSRNYNWDKEDGYKVPENRVLYNSYFFLADDNDTSIIDKLKLHGKEFTELCDGGMGCHINLQEHLSKEQYLKIIDLAIKYGTFYFTFNVPNTECLDCGHIEKLPIEVCPKCGSKHLTQWIRIIGYLRPIKCFDKYRQIEASTRVYSNGKEEIK